MNIFARLRKPATRSDEESLLRRAARGDERALTEVYEANVDGLYAFVFYRVGRDVSLAEDVVQETFSKALEQLERYDARRGSIQSWLCTTSRNIIRDHLRAHRRATELAAMWDRIDETLAQIFESLDRTPLSDEVIERAETRDLVNMTIANLPEKYRTALEWKYVEGDSLAAVAARLEMSEVAAKSLLARARRAFRETFSTLCQSMAEAK
jgi:RNA polymerase sigma-70 factor (ECF subfamily)